jgi:hypothetical protein
LGFHNCSLCAKTGIETAGIMWSRIVYIPGDSEVFVAPGGVVHYIESHMYLPPAIFIEAVLKCPAPDSSAYWAAMTQSNAGVSPPVGPQ